MVWCKTYLPGVFYDLVQAVDGKIVAVGEARATRSANGPTSSQTVGFNPVNGVSINLATIDCSTGLGQMTPKIVVTKVDLDGTIAWNNLYSMQDDHVTAWPLQGKAFAIANCEVDNASAFYIAGFSEHDTIPGVQGCALRIANDGSLIDKHMYLHTSSIRQVLDPQNEWNEWRIMDVDVKKIGTTQYVAISGFGRNNLDPLRHQAFVGFIHDYANEPYDFQFYEYTASAAIGAYHDYDKIQHSSSVLLAEENNGIRVIWPVLSNYKDGSHYWAGRSIADLFVYKWDPFTGIFNWRSDMGEVRAYDLQAEAIQTMDNNIAVVTTKRKETQFGWNDLIGITQNCLQQHFSLDSINLLGHYDYWNTDTYVSKLDLITGVQIWETTFDSEFAYTAPCWQGDLRRQECMYKITEAADGGLVVSGNTSHNFDDAYLAKLGSDCQAKLQYASLSLDSAGIHNIDQNATWTGNIKVKGVVRVNYQTTLTISNAHIEFADSDQLDIPTMLVVDPGGQLIIEDSEVTSIGDCPSSMWDGIMVRGDEYNPQGPAYLWSHDQGSLLTDNSILSNARISVIVSNRFLQGPLLHALGGMRSGGIVRAHNTVFRNNLYDVSFSPYENSHHSIQGLVLPNRSYFNGCSFVTEGELNKPNLFPRDHVILAMVRGINFNACEFRNDFGLGHSQAPTTNLGNGIRSINSTFSVKDICHALPPTPNPCPQNQSTSSAFVNLHRGIIANTFDLSRTFVVDHANFEFVHGGIRMEGIQNARITRNNFIIPHPSPNLLGGANYGIYSDQCTGYAIEENKFFGALTAAGKVGLVIRRSGPHYNRFYNNNFDRLEVGSLIQSKNANTGSTIGLEVKCNDFGLNNKNIFDVALTEGPVRIQQTQGLPIFNPEVIEQLRNPAGNRFSDHDPEMEYENDWYVQFSSTYVNYFHHTPESGNKTAPFQHTAEYITLYAQDETWPGKSLACPTPPTQPRTKMELVNIVEGHHLEYSLSKDEYDATRDDGDTYTLYNYVSDPDNSSLQVRNALQSVAPNASEEVFQAAFERDPPMDDWHLTEALISNSPLRFDTWQLMYNYLPEPYIVLVESAQSEEVNILSILQAKTADHIGQKSEALYEYGNVSWLDSTDISLAMDSLLWLHMEIPSENTPITLGGIYTVKEQYTALKAMADAASLTTTDDPEYFEMLAHYAEVMQLGIWNNDTLVDQQLLMAIADRELYGSAFANAWLQAFDIGLPQEVIVLPAPQQRSLIATDDPEETPGHATTMSAYPNPSNGVIYVQTFVPIEAQKAELRFLDAFGRELERRILSVGEQVIPFNTHPYASGVYFAELELDGNATSTVKLIFQQ